MYKFYFNNTTYIVIDILQSVYLSNNIKLRFTFYDSMIQKFTIIFSIDNIIEFLCKLKYFLDRLSIDPYDDNYIYTSNSNEYGDYIQISARYMDIPDHPIEDDDNVQVYISNHNEMYNRYSIIFTINTTSIILESFMEYIINILDSMNIDIISRSEVIFTNLLYGDFIR